MKRIAIVASGWHFPAHFYESMVRQKNVKGWKYEFFCVAHRSPEDAVKDKANHVIKDDRRGKLDKILYKEMATQKLIEALGWEYREYPNTIGDWGNSNQWLDDHNYLDYNLFLFTHDDNLILHDRLFSDMLEDENFKQWHIMCNSIGMPPGTVRGSFEFFKPRVLDLLGGKFNTDAVTLKREGIKTSVSDRAELDNWNAMTLTMQDFIERHKLKIAYLSPSYRVSAYCIEGERGYISNTHGQNTAYEEAGLTHLENHGVI